MAEHTCETCKWWDGPFGSHPNDGACRALPPGQSGGSFPETSKDEWCANHPHRLIAHAREVAMGAKEGFEAEGSRR